MASAAPLRLRVRSGGMQWRLQSRDAIEVWRGAELVAAIPAPALEVLLHTYVETAALAGWFASAMRPERPPGVRGPTASAPGRGPRVPLAEQLARQRARRQRARRA
jgi:hypothetical protein